MDYISVKCRHCGLWSPVVVEMKYRDPTEPERINWSKAAGRTKRVIE